MVKRPARSPREDSTGFLAVAIARARAEAPARTRPGAPESAPQAPPPTLVRDAPDRAASPTPAGAPAPPHPAAPRGRPTRRPVPASRRGGARTPSALPP